MSGMLRTTDEQKAPAVYAPNELALLARPYVLQVDSGPNGDYFKASFIISSYMRSQNGLPDLPGRYTHEPWGGVLGYQASCVTPPWASDWEERELVQIALALALRVHNFDTRLTPERHIHRGSSG